jgi:hypothetical protein
MLPSPFSQKCEIISFYFCEKLIWIVRWLYRKDWRNVLRMKTENGRSPARSLFMARKRHVYPSSNSHYHLLFTRKGKYIVYWE